MHPITLAAFALLTPLQAGPKPEEDFAGLVTTYLAMGLPTDWSGIEKLPGTKWAASSTSLQNCLPNGDCYARQGSVTLGGRTVALVATGARTMVVTLLFRNTGPAIGEAAILAALKQASVTGELVRCPIPGGPGSTNWYRLTGAKLAPAHLSIQTVTGARPSEGFVLTQGEELPKLQPNQLAAYSDKCAPGADRKPVSTLKPHEMLAQAVVAFLTPAGGAVGYDWKALTGMTTDVTWLGTGPVKTNLMTLKNDPNPVAQTGTSAYAGRKFSMMASGSPAQVKVIYMEELGLHPRGEHMLGVVYEKGITVQLVRCGPVYTESTNNWYSLVSAGTRPAMIQQSIRYDGNQVQDSYALRLDGTLPARDPRDRDPGVNGCR